MFRSHRHSPRQLFVLVVYQKTPKAPPRERLQCLDAVRGLNVMLMIFVDNCCDFDRGWIDHSPWNVVHLADFVMPLFLFMVCICVALCVLAFSLPIRSVWWCHRWACRWPSP